MRAAAAWLITAMVLGGCQVEFVTGENDAVKQVKIYAGSRGFAIQEPRCPEMDQDLDEYEGETLSCTAATTFSDGKVRDIRFDVAYDRCSIRSHSCYDIRVTHREPQITE